MKILYVITQADGGGAQKYTLTLAKHFNGALAAGNEADKLFTEAQRAGLQTFELQHLKRDINPWHDLTAIWEIRNLIKSFQPDLIHLNSSKAGILGSFAAIGTKTKVVFTAHGFVFNEPLSWPVKMLYLALEKIASDYRDHIITVSNSDKKSALDNKLIAQNKISTIHNGIGQIEFYNKNEAKKILGLPEDKMIIGCVANFYKTKGLDVLIDAISSLPSEVKTRCDFVLIGTGPEFENLKLKIENLKLSGIIKTPGNILNVDRYLKAFDIFILASRKEGFPYTLLEAMQAGLPIIATDVGGNKEALGDAAILAESENPKVLAEAITKLSTDTNLQQTLSKKAQNRSSLFTEEQMLNQTKIIYKGLLNL